MLFPFSGRIHLEITPYGLKKFSRQLYHIIIAEGKREARERLYQKDRAEERRIFISRYRHIRMRRPG